MPQPVKYSTSSVPNAIKKGNMAIGVNQVEYSPTSTTGWYAGINPSVSGYTVYVNKVTQGPSILVASNDNDLVSVARSQGASASVTTAAGALNYFASQSDMMVVNKNYNNIVTSGLVLNVDASFVASYPISGTSWYDLSGSGNTGTLVNGPTFNTNGWINFDGTNDQVNIPNNSTLQITGDQTLEFIVYPERRDRRQNWYNKSYGGEGTITYETGGTMNYYWGTAGSDNPPWQGVGSGSPLSLATLNRWYHVVLVRELSTPTKTVKWYINGSLNATVTASYSAATASSSQITLGNGYTNPFLGRLPVTRQYNIALSSSQVLQNYYGGPIVTSGLTFAVDAGNLVSFQNGSGSTFSLVGSYTGTLQNGVSYTTGNGGGWVFDGTDDYIDLPNSLGYSTTKLSVFSWFKSNGQPLGNYHIICGGQECEISIPWPSGALRTGVFTDTRFVSNNGSGLNDGVWHHIGFTFDGSTKTSFIDGVNVGTQTVTGTLITSFSNRRLGRFGSSAVYYVNGNISNYMVYDKVLSAMEVAQNFNAQKRRFGF